MAVWPREKCSTVGIGAWRSVAERAVSGAELLLAGAKLAGGLERSETND
jgi:hypothetical protein